VYGGTSACALASMSRLLATPYSGQSFGLDSTGVGERKAEGTERGVNSVGRTGSHDSAAATGCKAAHRPCKAASTDSPRFSTMSS
jgi:hypothetical protein